MLLGTVLSMQRWILVALGTLFLIAFGALTWRGGHSGLGEPTPMTTPAGTHAVGPGPSPSATAPADFSGSAASPGPMGQDAAVGMALPGAVPNDEDGGITGDAGAAAFLPTGTPKSVRFGVVVVRYRGAEGQPVSDRSKADAAVLARALADLAKTDFRGAVSRGDPGSMDDAGRMPRGVLEPTAEYALFTLKPGEVSDPIDTARGFWIMRRGD